ncbi:MAG: O-antigen ligase family protein [Candidatus Cloacimonetes bacterium]|nr:O-antigen ligase family protein [Candidatus Cloacimonadota bacterium]
MTESISDLKYIVFFATLFIGVPWSYFLCLRYPKLERIIFFLMIFTAKMEDINFVSRETFRLTSKGFEIGMVDMATFVIFLLVMHRKKQYPIKMPPGSYIFFAYFALSALSITNSAVVLFSLFELWKMVRMFLYFFVIYNYIVDFEQLNDFMKGVAAITIYIFIEVMDQKYLQRRFQSPGPFPHQNSLVMYMIIFGSLIFAFLLNKKDISFYKFVFWLVFFGMASVTVISALSRAGLVLFALSVTVILAMSFFAGITQKKTWIAGILIVASLAMLAQAWNSINERFRTAPEESAKTRVDLAVAALKMVKDKPLGIGLNNFGIKINPPWQYSSHIEMRDPDDEDEKNALVETVYLMIAAEAGWHTLALYFTLIFYMYFLNIRNFFRYYGSDFHYYTIGLLGGLLAIYIESGLEWVLKQTNNFYQLMMMFAIITVMYKLERQYTGRKQRLPQNLSKQQKYALQMKHI